MPRQPWRLLLSHGYHGAPLLVPPHTTIRQHSGRLLYVSALGVGHHGGRYQPFRSWHVDRCCGLVVGCDIHRNTYGFVQAIGNTLPMRWWLASSSASELSAWQPPHQICCCVVLSGQQHHWGMMCGGGGGKMRGRRAGRDDSYNRWVCASIDHGGRHCPTATMGPYSQLLTINQQTYYATGLRC